MIDLSQKIVKYKRQKLTYEEIKEKINSKCNKIISFGQTPFKLLEDKHPQWIQKKEINENILTLNHSPTLNTNDTLGERASISNFRQSLTFYTNDDDKNILGIKITGKILYFDIFPTTHKDNIKKGKVLYTVI